MILALAPTSGRRAKVVSLGDGSCDLTPHIFRFNLLFSLHLQIFLLKNESDAAGGCFNFCFLFCNTFFLCSKEKSISVCIPVLPSIIILIVLLNKWVYKQFVQSNTISAIFNKSPSFPCPSNLFQTTFLLLKWQQNKTTASEKQLAQFWV